MSDSLRVQFRLKKVRQQRLEGLAKAAGVSPHEMAKVIFERALDGTSVDPARLSDDLLVIRAGVEQMFRNSDRLPDLDQAIAEIKERRATARKTLVEGAVT